MALRPWWVGGCSGLRWARGASTIRTICGRSHLSIYLSARNGLLFARRSGRFPSDGSSVEQAARMFSQ